jgi:acetyltransferase-like isoleucine patch superfamily enzyme
LEIANSRAPDSVAESERTGRLRLGVAKAGLLQIVRFLTNDVIANVPFSAIRHFWYRRVLGVGLGSGSIVLMHVHLSFYGRPAGDRIGGIEIGKRTNIGRDCWLDGRGGLRIGDNVSINRGVWLVTADHDLNDPQFTPRYDTIEIGDRAFLGSRAMVLKGIKVGEGAVVAGGAVVTKDVPPYTIVAGNPARAVGMRSPDLSYELEYSPELE